MSEQPTPTIPVPANVELQLATYRRREPIYDAIETERLRQLTLWGDQRHEDGYERCTITVREARRCKEITEARAAEGCVSWANIFREEVAELFATDDPAERRAELIQIIAVGVAWIEDIDLRRKP